MRVVHAASELERIPRAVAIGTFDGVHRGHVSVIRAALESSLASTVMTFDPHPREALGNEVELINTLERRLELIAELGVTETVVVPVTAELLALDPEDFADEYLAPMGVDAVAVGPDFRFGAKRQGDATTLRQLGYETLDVIVVPGASSTAIRQALRDGDVRRAAELLGRPFELDGVVVAGDQRGGTLGYPTANLALGPRQACPSYGIYAGAALGHRAAISIGTNPHYGGTERRIEPYLLDFDDDLYGRHLRVEVWERLRDEAVFDSEQALIDQIGRDVEATRAATRPS